jgi:hypothetical protein
LIILLYLCQREKIIIIFESVFVYLSFAFLKFGSGTTRIKGRNGGGGQCALDKDKKKHNAPQN